jgi:hypothetical protein
MSNRPSWSKQQVESLPSQVMWPSVKSGRHASGLAPGRGTRRP